MKYPALTEIRTTRERVDTFAGYNHNLRIGEGEFYDMKNLSSDAYPVLSPRKPRGSYALPTNPQGMISKDSLCYVDGSQFIINSYESVSLKLGLSIDPKGRPKTLVSMGSYVIILPDKVWVNTQSEDGEAFKWGYIEASVTTPKDKDVKFTHCNADGEAYKDVTVSATAPIDPEDGEYWIDTSDIPHKLNMYSASNKSWVAIATTYIKIESAGANFSSSLAVGDGVTISGIEVKALLDLNGSAVIKGVSKDYIIVTGIIDKYEEQKTPITIKRQMPEMDFVIESGNRLWGCKYGIALNGEVVNEIYASKLGDFKNWNCYEGISTDSYAVTVGTDGQFTGAITHLGYPHFFKEGCMHKVYGNYPANFQVQTTPCRGVQKGCSRSLAIVNETLYYKSQSAICAYDGSLPTEVSAALGEVTYSDAVAGALGNKYYVSMKGEDELSHMFVFDTARGMWHKEDNTEAVEFCNCRGDLYYIEGNQIKTVKGSDPERIEWMAETGIIGMDLPDKKYIVRLDIRMSLTFGARVYLYVEYDSDGKWEHIYTKEGTSLESFAVPIRPKRCDHMRLRIVGEGEAKIFSLYKTIEQGSDM